MDFSGRLDNPLFFGFWWFWVGAEVRLIPNVKRAVLSDFHQIFENNYESSISHVRSDYVSLKVTLQEAISS